METVIYYPEVRICLKCMLALHNLFEKTDLNPKRFVSKLMELYFDILDGLIILKPDP